MSRLWSVCALAVLLGAPARAEPRALSAEAEPKPVVAAVEAAEKLLAQERPDWAAFGERFKALESRWAKLDAQERAPLQQRYDKLAAAAASPERKAASAAEPKQRDARADDASRAALAERIGVATSDLAGVHTGQDLLAQIHKLYDNGRIPKGTLDAAVTAMGSVPGAGARELSSVLTALQSQAQFRGRNFGALEPPPLGDEAGVTTSHGFDPYFDLKYPKGFAHLDHVNPDAPKGGELKFATTRKFDTYNPFDWMNGHQQNAAPYVRGLVFQTLMTGTGENGTSQYGLLAETIQYPKDLSWVKFKLNPKARFTNGEPVTADDIEFSYKKQRASDHYYDTAAMKAVTGVEVLDDRTIKFTLSAENERQARETISQLGRVYALNKEHYTKHPLESMRMDEPPVGTGPYVIEKGEAGKYVVYKRDASYWGKDLPLQKGQYNFDKIRYDYYSDATTARESFKRGDSNVWFESDEGQWKALQEDAARRGRFRTEEAPYSMPPGFEGLAFNTSKPVFADTRVRRALSLAMNFTWNNDNLFHGSLERSTSLFQRTQFAHQPEVSEAERRLLAGAPAHALDAEPLPAAPSAGDAYNRENSKRAMALLKDAGWSVDPKTLKLTNPNGEPFRFQLAYSNPQQEKWLLAYADGLRRLGIDASLRRFDPASQVRVVDQNQYDMVPAGVYTGDVPRAPALKDYFGSEAAARTQSARNVARIRNPAVDALIERIDKAKSNEEWVTASRALDRLLLAESYYVPMGTTARDRVAIGPGLEHEKDPSVYYGFDTVRTWWAAPK